MSEEKGNIHLASPFRSWPYFVIVLLLVLVTWNFFARRGIESPVTWNPDETDVGLVWQSRSHKHTVTIKNRSQHQQVHVNGFVTSCICTSIDPPQLTLKPGEERELTVTLDLTATPISSANEDLSVMTFSVTVAPRILNDTARPLPIELHGRIKRPFQVLDRRIVFDGSKRLMRGQTASETIRLDAVSCGEILPTTTAGGDVALAIDNQQCLLTYTCRDLPIGPFADRVRLDYRIPGGDLVEGPEIEIRGTVVSDVQCLPEHLRLTSNEARQSFVVESSIGRSFRVKSVTSDLGVVETQTPDPSSASRHLVWIRLNDQFDIQEVQYGTVGISIEREDNRVEELNIRIVVDPTSKPI